MKNPTQTPARQGAGGTDETTRLADAEAKRLADEEKARADAEAKRLADEEKAKADAEAKRLADQEKARADAEAERLANEEKAEAERVAAAARVDPDGVVLKVVALSERRRAGRAWAKGETDITAKALNELGHEGIKALLADSQFVLTPVHPAMRVFLADEREDLDTAADMPGAGHVMTVTSTVADRRRAGRSWPRGATHLTASDVASIGAAGIAALKADRAFIVIEL